VRLARVALANVRNYATLEFEPEPGLNVFVGENAQGKSNLLEAIGVLGTGKSFRTSREAELVRWGTPLATLGGTALARAGSLRLACTIEAAGSGTRKRYTVNGSGVGYATYLGRLRVVTFVPSDLQLVGGPPVLRRSMLNAALSQDQRAYYAALAAYRRDQQQKGALLRAPVVPDRDLLATYDERLVRAGTVIMLARRAFIAELDERARAIHRSWVGDREGTLRLVYEPNVPFEVPTADGIAAAFEARLREAAPQERLRRTTLVGPHRDDLGLFLDETSLGNYGSQGQRRTAVLALKLAEFGVLEARGEAPIALLDDVLSELDAERQEAFLAGVGRFGQAFVTTTHPIPSAVGRSFRVAAATVAPL
jgi:DNA replication and repair protein RecF